MHEAARRTRCLERWPGSQQVELGSRPTAARTRASQEPAPGAWASGQDPWEAARPRRPRVSVVGDGGCGGPRRCQSSFWAPGPAGHASGSPGLRPGFGSSPSGAGLLGRGLCLRRADPFRSPSLQRASTSLGCEGELDRGQCRRLCAPGNC